MATALTVQQQLAKDIQGALFSKSVLDQIKMALPDIGVNPERVARTAFTSIMKNADLLQCSTHSLVRSLILSAQYGVLPDGRMAHLIPYGKECTFILDYKGMCVLIRRNPNVADVWAEVVYDNDEFHVSFGCERNIERHIPYYILNYNAQPGNMVLAYAVIKYIDGGYSFVIMPKSEIEHIRDTYGNARSKMWKNDTAEAWKKTAIRRIAKTADLDPVTAAAIQASDEGRDQSKLFAEAQIITGSSAIDVTGLISDLQAPDEDNQEAQMERESATRASFAERFGQEPEIIEFSTASAQALDKSLFDLMEMALENPNEFESDYKKWLARKQASNEAAAKPRSSAQKISADQAREIDAAASQALVPISAIKRHCSENGFFIGKNENLTDISADRVDDLVAWISSQGESSDATA